MKVQRLEVAEAGRLAAAYNALVVADGVPHCWAVTEEEFAAGLVNRPDDVKPGEWLHSDALFACEEGGRVTAYSHVALGEIDVEGTKHSGGHIRFFAYARGCRAAGAAVLTESERHLTDAGAERLWACEPGTGSHFYHLGFGGLSDRAGNVCGLLGRQGYEAEHGEVFMRMPEIDVEVPEPPAGAEVEIEEDSRRGELPGVETRALMDGRKIGECGIRSAGEYVSAAAAQRTCFVLWLGVEAEWQGKGLGRVLLMKALEHAKELGYESAVISTDQGNHRALTFYTNYGFRVTDTLYGLAKKAE